MNKGINYTTTGDADRNRVVRYHGSPSPINRDRGAKNSDIKMLKQREKRNLYNIGDGDFKSQFAIGFEIEKTAFSRGAVTEYALFSGFENDGSCGVEAITHILPLISPCEWRNKVFNMFYEAERIIDDSYSPSDMRCGGHITLSADRLCGTELMEAVRKFSGVMYALFRGRLSNSYCNANWQMDSSATEYSAGRYQVCLRKGDRIEFRLPSRVKSVKQLMRRYELCYAMLDFAVNRPNSSFKTFMKHVRPIVSMMYSVDETQVDSIMAVAEDFQKSINRGAPVGRAVAYLPNR